MANRYWVGGTAAWDGTAGTKWALTSGGAGGQAIPTSADDVFFDSASGASTVTISTGNTGAQSINCSTFTGTLTGTVAISVAGSVTLVTGMTYTHTGTMTFIGTGTLTTAGKTFSGVTVNAAGITVALGDDLNISTRTLTITSGTFDTAGFSITAAILSSSGSVARTINLNSSTVTLSSLSTAINFATSTNLTFNAGTSQITLTAAAPAFSGGSRTFYNVSLTNTASTNAATQIIGSNTFNNLTINGPATTSVQSFTFYGDQTINGTLTLNSSSTNATQRLDIRSDTVGTVRTLTCAAVASSSNVDFRDITIAGAAAPISGTRLGDAGNNSGITFSAGVNKYWNLAAGGNWSATAWALSSGGSPAVNNFPLAQDTVYIENTGLNTSATITLDVNWYIGTVDMSSRTNAMTLALGTNLFLCTGSFIAGSGVSFTNSGNGLYMQKRNGTASITSTGRAFPPVVIEAANSTISLADDLISSGGFTVSNGTFNTANFNINATYFFSSYSSTRTITLGTSTINLRSTGTVWSTATTTGLTFSGASSTINLADTSTTARTFTGGGLTFGTLNIGGATGISTTTITNNAGTFATISSSKTVAHTINFTANCVVNNWTVTGTAGNIVTVNSSVVNTQRIITFGGSSVSMDYMSIKDIAFSYTLGASNPYIVYAGANSTNGGNTSGILFQPTTVKAYLLTTGTTWTTPADWNNSNNTIHMIGAGGGGATSAVSGNNRAAGGGGGGGGYRVLTNQTLSGSIPYTIGTSAGNANGGSTTFNTTNTAGGGSKGNAATTPSSSGGAGGTGTFAGGTGGAGAFGTTASQSYGAGGGGGAGGPNGIGGNGGNGFGSTTEANISGGGGGGNGGGSNATNGSSALGGTGGNNSSGTGGGIGTSGLPSNGTLGGGGSGGVSATTGGYSDPGIDIANTIGGSGGRGGKAFSSSFGPPGYGGGGTGGAVSTAGATIAAGIGGQGLIFIVYTPGSGPAANNNFFLMFG